MNTKEFSQRFDSLLNSQKDYKSYGGTLGHVLTLNEYEKSLYLTTAQEDIVFGLVTGNNSLNQSFDKSEEVRRYLQALIHTESFTEQTNSDVSISQYSQFYSLDNIDNADIWRVVYEEATLVGGVRVTEVKPVPHATLKSILQSPHKSNFLKRTFRLDTNDYGEGLIELINSYEIVSYKVRYLKRPCPIILEDFENVSINGIKIQTECELHESLHSMILLRAYEMSLQAYATSRGMLPKQPEEKEKNSK